MARDMNRQCFRCKQVVVCCYSDSFNAYCCGDCWEDAMTKHSETWRCGDPRYGARASRDGDDDATPWAAIAVRQLEDG